MNVDQCQWPKKMMGRGVDGGCGAEERPCRPFRKATIEKENGNKGSEEKGLPEIDLLAQASKSLSERSPYDFAEDGSTLVVSVPTLPIVLANLLNQKDNKKRHKKSHSGTEKKNSSRQGEKLKTGSIWDEQQDYFRPLELSDLGTLLDLASPQSVPSMNAKSENVVDEKGVVLDEMKDSLKKEEVNEDVGKRMSVDNIKDEISSGSDYSGSLERVLGCRNRILLSERPSKKRKLLGGDTGLGKSMAAAPCKGDALLCDCCCTGDAANESHHQLIVCTSCKATVHKKCYGVVEDTDKSCLCSWCGLENDDSKRPCLLCPKKNCNLKSVLSKTENGGSAEFHIENLKNGNHTICNNFQSQSADCGDTFCQLSKARKLGLLDLSPDDEVEGELLYYQLQLLGTAVSRKQLSDNLAYEVAKKLPLEIDEQHGRKWDDVLVNKYFHDVREAKKQCRKEKRHKQAQTLLAAATAAAATSSRNTSLRKDMSEEPAQQGMSTSRRKVAVTSHLGPQAKETLLKMAVPGPPSDKLSDHRIADFSIENSQTCDICRRSETIWNPIVECSSCKVSVHMDCYKCAKESTGPWYCELCAESSSGPSLNSWGKPYSSTECVVCVITTGAFRKASNGQWIHAFCAEWSLESTFRRGQISPVQGLESLAKNMHTCCVCRRIYGACIKCSYGNCQSTFHPSCARNAGFHMCGGGKLPHKAYCEKHSLEQKAKAESQKHGAEAIKSLKLYRVELERLRLLCERIVKREKLKRELTISSHEILAAKRDQATSSLPVCNPCSPPEVSSDNITVDSTVSDQKTDDNTTPKGRFSRKPTAKQILSRKTAPRKHCIVSPNVSEDGVKDSKTKKVRRFRLS